MCLQKMVFFHIGWMERYCGLTEGDRILGGGRFVEDEGWGYEIFNFKPYKGHLYGYVEAPGGHIDTCRVGDAKDDDSSEHVLVISTAPHPDRVGAYIVGWYQNATVYRSCQESPGGSGREHNGQNIGYYASTRELDGYLLRTKYRNFPMLVGEGGMGKANLCYCDAESSVDFRKRVLAYIESAQGSNYFE